MIEFIDELKALMEKHKVTLQGQLLILRDNYPQEVEYNSQAMWGKFNVRDHASLMFSPILPAPVAEDIKANKSVYISSDIEGYTCPVTNNWIEGRAAHRENLKRQGCRVFEPGEREQFIKEKPKEIERSAEKAANFFAERIAEQI